MHTLSGRTAFPSPAYRTIFRKPFLFGYKDAIQPISYISDKSLTGDTGHKKSKKGTRILEGFVYLCNPIKCRKS